MMAAALTFVAPASLPVDDAARTHRPVDEDLTHSRRPGVSHPDRL